MLSLVSLPLKAYPSVEALTCVLSLVPKVNDAFTMDGDKITTTTNNSGGIKGGITNGLPLVMQVGIKPTPSIYKEQHSVSLSQKGTHCSQSRSSRSM